MVGDLVGVVDWSSQWSFSMPLFLTIQAFSPVDLEVTDPEGKTISKGDTSAIPSSSYGEMDDLNGDGHLDDEVVIPDPLDERYLVKVVAEPGANPTDTYTLDVFYGGESTRLAENVEVQKIPAKPYIYPPDTEFSCNMEEGWNLISIPVRVTQQCY